MPSACETTETSSNSSNTASAATAASKTIDASGDTSSNSNSNGQQQQQTNGQQQSTTATTTKGSNGTAAAAAGFIDDDVDYELPTRAAAVSAADSTVVSAAAASPPSQNGEKGGEASTTSADDFIFIQDTGFNVKICPPGMEPFELQVSPLELVQEINHQLIDREDTCHRTCFSLQLDGVTLDNFSELKNIEGLKEGSVIRVVEEPYTVREARIHVRHVRDLLKSLDASDAYNGVDCSSLSFMNLIAQTDVCDSKGKSGGGGGGKSAAASARNAADNSGQLDCLPPDFVLPIVENLTAASSNGTATTTASTVPNGNAQSNHQQQQNGGGGSPNSPPPTSSPPIVPTPTLSTSPTSSSAPSSSSSSSTSSVQLTPLIPQPRSSAQSAASPTALKVLTASGWNPPPGSRKLKGDLMYLYVVTLEEKRIHITASTRGFYVNLSTDEVFNPKAASGEPAVGGGGRQQIFHSLVDLLSQLSPAFRRNYALIQRRRHQRHPFERLVTPYQLYSWAAPALEHTVDSIRAEDAFSSKLGYEEHMPGQTRDWNEELQTTRELPRKTLAERIIRERAIFKVHSDFVGAATRGAMAVVDGNVMALNPSEDTKMQMFIWNNIFFSLGFDVRDHYKELGGDAAAFAAPCNDLHGVRAYAAIDIEGLYTLATAVVDYKGFRVTAQSIIPGILERDQEQSVVYGSIDFGKTVVTNERYLELLNKAGQALKIVPHKVLSGAEDTEVEICSSVECKGIIGNDSRHYILDLLRTFPPDPHFVVVEEQEGRQQQEKPELSADMVALGFPRRHKHKLCSLRQELVDAFFESRYILFIKLAALYLQQSDIKKFKSGAAAADTAEEQESKAIEAAMEKLGEEDAAEEEEEKKKTKTEEKGDDKKKKTTTATSIDASLKVSEDYKKLIETIAASASAEKKETAAAESEPAKVVASNEEEEDKSSKEVAIKGEADATVASGESDSSASSQQQLSPRDLENTREIIRKAAADVGSLSETEFDLRFNPDIYSPGVRHADVEGAAFARQKKLIRDAAEFLIKSQIPSLIRDSLEHSQYLYDGLTLTEAMHSRGINIRYLGRVADMVAKHETLDYLMNIVVTELVCRSAKHLFTAYIQSVEVVYLSTAIAHFLNCLLSSAVANPAALFASEETGGGSGKSHGSGKRKGKKGSGGNGGGGGSSRSAAFKKIGDQSKSTDWASLTARTLWGQLRAEMDAYYGWSVGGVDSVDALLSRYAIQKISLLRLFSLRTGLQVLLREYHFEHRTRPAFSEEDVLNVFPIVKHIAPRASDAYNFFQTGQRKIQEGALREGYEYITEALNLFNNVYGPLHTDIVQCLRLLGRINYVLGDYQEACSFQQKAVLMSEKVNGIDHPHTITEYNFLALYSFSNQQISASLKFLYRARYLLALIHGQNHPEMAIVDSNIGLILHAIGEYESSLRFLEHALALNLHYFGRRHLKVALSYHLVARTLSCMGLFRGALTNEKETYAIYKRELGEGHEKTKESSECLRHLTNQAVVLQKKMNEIYKGNVNTIIPPIQIQPPSISAVLEMLNVVNGILFLQISAADVENLKEMQSQQQQQQQGSDSPKDASTTPTDKKEEEVKAIKEAGEAAAVDTTAHHQSTSSSPVAAN